MILMIDNYDSFTYNLVQYLAELGCDVHVSRNDKISIAEIEQLAPQRIVISPGPCTPNEAGISMDVVRHFGQRLPILGVCLGHQCIGQVYGGTICRAREIMHGKTSMIHHTSASVFSNLSDPFEATRYHSLVIDKHDTPKCLDITAWTITETGDIDEIMGVKHKQYPISGVQFHPESILTQHGHKLLENFLNDA